jgi:hypothetical protein
MTDNEPQIGQPIGSDPEQLSRLLEIELIQKRAAWRQTSERTKNLRSASFFFLFVVVIAGLVAGYFAFMRASEGKQHRPAQVDAPARP